MPPWLPNKIGIYSRRPKSVIILWSRKKVEIKDQIHVREHRNSKKQCFLGMPPVSGELLAE